MDKLRIAVTAAPRPAWFCPVSVEVSRSPRELASCVLIDEREGVPVPFQASGAAGGARLHWIVRSLAPRQERTYLLQEGAPPPSSQVKVKAGEDRVSVRIGGALFTRYLFGGERPKPCLYPLVGPYGHGVTRAYPQEEVEGDSTDHVHHRSLWVAWGDVNGSDNWGEAEGAGRMVHRYFDATESGPVFGRIAALNDWVDAGGNRLMQDLVEYRFYNVPPSLRLFDLTVAFFASEGEVRFGDTKEGGIISVRVATPMEGGRGGLIRNALGGLSEAETWGRRASWCDYCGTVGGHRAGIAVFDHPHNLRYPTFWHVRDYGLMTANPFGLSYFPDGEGDGSYVLPAGGKLTFRYRVLIHAGQAEAGGVADRYLDWLFPPRASVEA